MSAGSRKIQKVLVAYASANGATTGIAERIAQRLREFGNEVELRRVQDIGNETNVFGLVLGSGIYNGRWLPEATEFVERRFAAHAPRHVWLFSAAAFGDTHPLVGRFMRKEPRDIDQLLARTKALDYRVFAGVVERQQWPWFGRATYRALGGHFGDHREWTLIQAWADQIAHTLDATRAKTQLSWDDSMTSAQLGGFFASMPRRARMR